jgi:hypothetical protein
MSGQAIWAAVGTLFEQIINAEGESQYRELTRHHTKRETTCHKDGNTRHQFYPRYRLPCPDHDCWEPLLTTTEDRTPGAVRSGTFGPVVRRS